MATGLGKDPDALLAEAAQMWLNAVKRKLDTLDSLAKVPND